MRFAVLALAAFVPAALAQAPAPGPAPDALPLEALAPQARLAGEALERTGVWGEGPSYAVAADAQGRTAWGSGRVFRAAVPGQTDTVTVQLQGIVRDIALAWPLAFVGTEHYGADDASGLEVLDLQTGTVGGRLTGALVSGVHADGALLTLAAYDGAWALRTVDGTDPAAPAEIGRVELSGFLRGVEVRDGVAYVGAGSAGVHVADVSTPAAPTLVRTVPVPGYARYLDVGDGGLAVAFGSYGTGTGGVQFYGLGDPTTPQANQIWLAGRVVEDVAWLSTTEVAAAASYDGVYQVGTDGAADALVETFSANLVPGSNRVVALPDGTVLAADFYYGGFRADLSAETFEPAWTGASFTFEAVVDAADAATLYVAAGAYGVVRLRAQPDGSLVETGRAHDPGWNYSYDLAQDDDYLYVADGFSGLHVVDKGTLQRVATEDGFYLDEVAVGSSGRILAASQNGAVAARWAGGVLAVEAVLGSGATDVAAADGIAYLALTDAAQVFVYDMVAFEPVDVLALGDGDPGPELATETGRLVAHAAGAAADLFDLSVPRTPARLHSVTPLGSGGPLALGGRFVATAPAPRAATVWDSQASSAVTELAGVTDLARSVSALAVTDGDLFVGVASAGVERFANAILVASEGAPPERGRLAVSPNPTAGAVQIELGREAPARVEVWTVTGRRVRVLDAVGARQLTWDGRDASGQRAAAGVYLVRVSTSDTVETVPVTVVR